MWLMGSNPRVASGWAIGLLAVAVCVCLPLSGSGVRLRGRVVDEDGAPVSGALLHIEVAGTPAGAPPRVIEAKSDPAGNFELDLPQPGDFLVSVTRAEYFEIRARPLHAEGPTELTLVMNHLREVFQSLDVNAEPSPLDLAEIRKSEYLTGTEINDVPYPNSHSLRSSMQLMPGVLLDPSGGLHFNGSSENQLLYQLNGFNITDPVSNQFHTTLAVEGVRELQFSSGREPAQFGKGSAGSLAITSDSGSDVFRYSVTDFVPGLSFQQGVRFGNWYPRVAFSGPIVRKRAWFSETFGWEYTQSLVTDLPSGENTRTSNAAASLLHGQFNWSPTHIVFADFLVNVSRQNRFGLGSLDPVSTTSELRGHEYMGGVRDYLYLPHGALIDFGYAHNGFSTERTPQGTNLYIYSPEGRKGNYFVTSDQGAARDQILIHGASPSFHFAGSHRIEVGAGVDFVRYDADFRRTGYQLIGLGGYPLSETLFQGNGDYKVHDTQADWYLADTWSVSKRFQINWGLRQDWDRRIADAAWSPRIGFSWSPRPSGRTRIAGGYSITRDAVPLSMLGRPLDQSALTTSFNPDGSPAGPPAPSAFFNPAGALLLPRAENWSIGVDQQFRERYRLGLHYLRRRLTDGFVFVNSLNPAAPPYALPFPSGTLPGAYQLTNQRQERYDAVAVSVRRAYAGQYEWFVSYTYSRASTNTLLAPDMLDPLQVLPSFSPIPWDAPHRVLGWAYMPLPWKNWAFASLLDARTGFPFSVVDETGLILGPVNSYRYPWNVDLNLAVERMFRLRGYRFALRLGANNVTNQGNYTAVNNTAGSPHYLEYYGKEGRHYVVRVRFFGRGTGGK